MATPYKVIEIHTSEEARHEGVPLYEAVLERLHALGAGARCVVTKGVAGEYESGERATGGIEILSFNLPIKIEIVLPAAEIDRVLPAVEALVHDGVVLVGDRSGIARQAGYRLLPERLRVRDAMTAAPRAVGEDTPVREVAELLVASHFKGVPVVDAAGRPVGIITPWNLASRAGLAVRPGILKGMEPDRVRAYLAGLPDKAAGEVMSPGVVTVREDEALERAVAAMVERGLKRLPVVDAGGRLSGMLSRIDVFRAVVRDAGGGGRPAAAAPVPAGGRTCADVMDRDAPTIAPDTPLEGVVRLVATPGTQRVAVTDAGGRLLGLVSDRILLDALVEHRAGILDLLTGGFSFARLRRNLALLRGVRARKAADVMLVDPVTVREGTPIAEAMLLMTLKRLKRLPVVDGEGRFKGMVGRDYLLRAGLAE